MRNRIVINTLQDQHTCTKPLPRSLDSSLSREKLWRDVIFPAVGDDTIKERILQYTAIRKEQQQQHDLTARYDVPSTALHVVSDEGFDPSRDLSLRGYVAGSLATRYLIKRQVEAMQRQEERARGTNTSNNMCALCNRRPFISSRKEKESEVGEEEGTEQANSSCACTSKSDGGEDDFVLLRDKFEGRPHPWRRRQQNEASPTIDAADVVDLVKLLAEGSSDPYRRIEPLFPSTAPRFNVSIAHQGPMVVAACHDTQAVGVDVMVVESIGRRKDSYNCSYNKNNSSANTEGGSVVEDDHAAGHEQREQTSTNVVSEEDDDVEEFLSDFVFYFTQKELEYIRYGHSAYGHTSSHQHHCEAKTVVPSSSHCSSSFLKLKRFYILWCLKEAFIKAIGAGFSFGDLQRAEFSFTAPKPKPRPTLAERAPLRTKETEKGGESDSDYCNDNNSNAGDQKFEDKEIIRQSERRRTVYAPLHGPSEISLRLDGISVTAERRDVEGGEGERGLWSFWVYDLSQSSSEPHSSSVPRVHAVAAVAEGPFEDAACFSHWGRAMMAIPNMTQKGMIPRDTTNKVERGETDGVVCDELLHQINVEALV